ETRHAHNIPIIACESGVVKFKDLIDGLTYRSDIDPSTGRTTITIADHKEDLNPTIEIVDKKTKKVKAFQTIPTGAQVIVSEGDQIVPGMILAKTPRSAAKTQDITGGLPRVAELFEARRPKDAAEIARSNGIVKIGGTRRKKTILRIVPKSGEGSVEEHLIPTNKRIIVQPDDEVKRGQPITEGGVDPSEILEVMGRNEVQEYLIREIQKVYRSQGVTINDKHIEVIASRMLRKVRVTDPGDTDYYWGQSVDRYEFEQTNKETKENGGKEATADAMLLGITKASLETESFISAASFQETTRVLTEAATLGKRDDLSGFKENVIMGNLIPAGTGLAAYRKLRVTATGGVSEKVFDAPSSEAGE
ncbi:MAG: DNA-directed RNA polymerase subunit beta', partial [Opitutales bacterium]|nr:DNA-directed RNA polymerase subunit beta' [Opitutales bacterium]